MAAQTIALKAQIAAPDVQLGEFGKQEKRRLDAQPENHARRPDFRDSFEAPTRNLKASKYLRTNGRV
jgi:hypothetical protein